MYKSESGKIGIIFHPFRPRSFIVVLSTLWEDFKRYSPFSSLPNFFGAQSVLDKISAEHVQTTSGYIFSKYVHCDMQFLDIKINALPCFINGLGILVIMNNKLSHYLYNDLT